MTFRLIALLLVAFPVVIFAACSYSQFGDDHTMCNYTAKPCAAGDKNCKRGLSESDIATCLKTHNDWRSKVANGSQAGQPKGANIREVKWDKELATFAQRWADQCTFEHDKNRRTAANAWVGQNLAITMNSAPTKGDLDFKSQITAWYDEVKNFPQSNINPFKSTDGKVTGHYTQVVWADSDRVGCGASYYKEGTGRTPYKTLYVCDYGPGGNVIGTSMYAVGEPASACKNGKSTAYPSLCAS